MWQFVAWLGCSRRGLADTQALRAWLGLHAGRGAPIDDARIAAIRQVDAGSVLRAFRGAAVCGSHYRITLARAGFASEGAAYAFGAVLHRMLTVDARLNGFADLTVTLSPSGPQFDYRGEPAW